jgi:hypothetical protein
MKIKNKLFNLIKNFKKNKFNYFSYVYIIFCIYLLIKALQTLIFDGWGYDSFYLHKLLFLLIFYLIVSLDREINIIKLELYNLKKFNGEKQSHKSQTKKKIDIWRRLSRW